MLLTSLNICDRANVIVPSSNEKVDNGENNNHAKHQDVPIHCGRRWMWCRRKESHYERKHEEQDGEYVQGQSKTAEGESRGK